MVVLAGILVTPADAGQKPKDWRLAWPRTDFNRQVEPRPEIVAGSKARDELRPIDRPVFVATVDAARFLRGQDPVVSVAIGGESKAYPLSILIWHQVVNDTVGGRPIVVSYCPLSDAVAVYDRRLNGREMTFGTSGMMSRSNTIMWDRVTESWWQQYTGQAIVGELAGARLARVPARVEAYARFLAASPGGDVLAPPDPSPRQYGANPFTGYDQSRWPFLYRGMFPKGIAPMERVVAVGKEAWSFDLLREQRRVEAGDVAILWEPGQASALDKPAISDGRDVGNVVVRRRGPREWEDAAYSVSFAFTFHAFHPTAPIYIHCPAGASGWDVERPLTCMPVRKGARR